MADVSEAQRLKQSEEENRKLKRILADQAMDLVMLKDLVEKIAKPEAKRVAVAELQEQHGTSERRACRLVGLKRSSHRYRQRRNERRETLRTRVA